MISFPLQSYQHQWFPYVCSGKSFQHQRLPLGYLRFPFVVFRNPLGVNDFTLLFFKILFVGFPHFPWILSRSPLELNCFLCVPSVVLWCPWYCQQFWVPTPPKTKTVSVFSLLSRQTLLQSAFWTSKATNLATVNFFLAPRPQNHGTVSIFWLPGPTILVLSAFWVPKALVSIFKPPGPQTLGNVSESLQFSLLSLWYLFETQ